MLVDRPMHVKGQLFLIVPEGTYSVVMHSRTQQQLGNNVWREATTTACFLLSVGQRTTATPLTWSSGWGTINLH